MIFTPLPVTDNSPGRVSSQLPPGRRRQIDDDGAGFHAFHHFFGNQLGRGFARNGGGGDDDVHFFRLLGKELHLGCDKFVAHHFGVAVSAAARFLWEVEFQELAAHRFDLFRHFQAGIERAYHCAERVCRTDRRQTCHTCTNHQNLRGRHFAGGGNLTGEETAEGVGGFNYGAVAADVCHRRQSVQSLRARNAGHHIHRQRVHFLGAQGFDQSLVLARPQEADDGLTFVQKRQFLFGRRVDLINQRADPNRRFVGNGCACCLVSGIVQTCRQTCTAFDNGFKAQFAQQGDGGGRTGDAGFAG